MSSSNRNRFRILKGIGFYCTAGPNTALIKSSRDCAVSITIGGRLPYIPVLERIDKLDLKLRTLIIETASETLDGISTIVKGCVQFKIPGWSEHGHGQDELSKNALEAKNVEMSINESAIKLAAQHFLGKEEKEINDIVLKTVIGHQRAITGALTFNEIEENRNNFLKKVIDICSCDMQRMGLAVVSYTLIKVSDNIGHSFNRGVTEGERIRMKAIEGKVIHQNAAIAKAAKEEANRYLIEKRQEQKKIESDKHNDLKLLETQQIVSRQRAIQQKAHSITSAEQNAILFTRRKKAEEKEVEAELEVMRQRIKREKLKQERNIQVDADARLYESKVIAERMKEMASAEAEKIRLHGKAEGEVIKSRGLAEMNVLRERNEIWKESETNGTIIAKMIETLPEMTAIIAEPLKRTEKIVFISSGDNTGSGGISSKVNELITEVPEVVEALTGVDMKDMLKNTSQNESASFFGRIGIPIGNNKV